MTASGSRLDQRRGLLILMVLLPLLPAVVMLRFMMAMLESERIAARERTEQVYRGALEAARAGLRTRLASPGADAPAVIGDFLRGVFGPEVRVRVVPSAGSPDNGDPVATMELVEGGQRWRVELFSVEPDPEQARQFQVYAWTAGGAMALTLTIAGVAALSVSRRLRLHELESSALETLSHELRTPLSSTRVLLETLQSGPGGVIEREYLDLIAAENGKLIRLTENFLHMARLEADAAPRSPERIGARSLIDAALERVPGSAEVKVRVPAPEPALSGDGDALVMLLSNLIDNAVKYSGGASGVEVSAASANGKVVIRVADRGPGVPPEERRRIFRKFHRVDQRLSRRHPGCGLGLYIVKQIAQQHGGRVTVEDRPGGGSVFVVTLPGGGAA